MYTTIIHPYRKALNLSLNEYCVLEEIRVLSHNFQYGGWCIKSKENIAKNLDISKRQLLRIIKALELKNLIIKDKQTKYLRSTDTWNFLIAEKENLIVGTKTINEILLTAKISTGDIMSPTVT